MGWNLEILPKRPLPITPYKPTKSLKITLGKTDKGKGTIETSTCLTVRKYCHMSVCKRGFLPLFSVCKRKEVDK